LESITFCGENMKMGSENSENQGNGIIWDQCFSSVEENPVVPQAFGIKIGVFLGSLKHLVLGIIKSSFWDHCT
jgi:hypothetical protein